MRFLPSALLATAVISAWGCVSPTVKPTQLSEPAYLFKDKLIKGGTVFISIDDLYKESDIKIICVTPVMSFDCGVDICFENKKDKTEKFSLSVISFTDGDKNANKNGDTIRIRVSKKQNDVYVYAACLIEPRSAFEEKMCRIVERIARDSSFDLERYNAEELLKVLKDRKYKCKWHKFWILSEGKIVDYEKPLTDEQKKVLQKVSQ